MDKIDFKIFLISYKKNIFISNGLCYTTFGDCISLANMLSVDFITHVIDVAIKIWDKDRIRRKKLLLVSNSLIFILLHYDNNYTSSISIRPHYM